MDANGPAGTALEWLRLQIEWGADEALDDAPTVRLGAAPAVPTPVPPTPAVRSEGVEASRPAPLPTGVAGPVAAARAAVASAADHDALRAAVAAFTATPLRRTAGAVAFADGAAAAAVAVVIDTPSSDDDASGRPLSGADGRLVARMLGSVAIAPDHTRALCLVPWRPPGDRPPSATEIATGETFARASLRLAPPRALVLCGTATVRTLGATAGPARRAIGQVVPVGVGADDRQVPALLLPSPGQLVADPRAKRLAWAGLLALADTLFPS